jgi:hypothetical protein
MFGRCFLFLFAIYGALFVRNTTAQAAYTCEEAAQETPMITLRYKYGNLRFDSSKSTSQVSQICGDKAAGCFHHRFGAYTMQYNSKTVKAGSRMCAIPQLTLDFDFSGSEIFITKDYTACMARAGLRHELQHFTIWKTATEEMLKEMKVELKNMAMRGVKTCKTGEYCYVNWNKEMFGKTDEIWKKWEQLSKMNNERLDEVDHNDSTEFTYKACEHNAF